MINLSPNGWPNNGSMSRRSRSVVSPMAIGEMNLCRVATSSRDTSLRPEDARADVGFVRYGSAILCRACFRSLMAGTFLMTIFSHVLAPMLRLFFPCCDSKSVVWNSPEGLRRCHFRIIKSICSPACDRVQICFGPMIRATYLKHLKAPVNVCLLRVLRLNRIGCAFMF